MTLEEAYDRLGELLDCGYDPELPMLIQADGNWFNVTALDLELQNASDPTSAASGVLVKSSK